MLHYRWFGTCLNALIIICLIFVFSGWTKQPTKTAVLEEKAAAEQQAVHSVGNVKQMVSEKKAGAAKPYLPPKEANLPLD
jgi:hypothetical protein